MKLLVTGSSGHLGEALMRSFTAAGHLATGIDLVPGPFTPRLGSIADRAFVDTVLSGGGFDAVLHAATLHKPHVGTHSRAQFVETNVTGTLHLLEAAVEHGVRAFVYTSTTSAFGAALTPPPGEPAAWITESVVPVPKNIYGATKCAAEDLCRLVHRDHGLPVVVLRTSRFFPENDDDEARRAGFEDLNLKMLELAYRRVDLQDVVDAHACAIERAARIGFDRFVISAPTPFQPADAARLRGQAAQVLRERVPGIEAAFAARGWKMLDDLDRVYDSTRARERLGWAPRYDLARAVADLAAGREPRSPLALQVGHKGYHPGRSDGGIYSVRPASLG